MRRRPEDARRAWSLVAVVAASVALYAADTIRITPLVRDDRVLISCDLPNAFNDEVRAAIASGLRTTFTYTVDLRMEVPAWVDRTIDTAVVSNSDQYDNLTRRHSLLRTIDGRVEEALVTEDASLVPRFMTTLDRLPLFRTSRLEPNREYYVEVRVKARPHGGSVFGWVSAASAHAKFTFLR
ncbi:MAG: DUF4390 domain-containing protein [Acidobacteria bacterium]|nr:DUF4390 domain-containing protein [Acidobacteriota bacterium]